MANEGSVLNSRRRLFRVAYTPLSIPVDGVDGDALMKGAFLRFLGLTAEEAQALQGQRVVAPLVAGLVNAQTEDQYLGAVRRLARLERPALVDFASELAKLREVKLTGLTRSIQALDHSFLTAASSGAAKNNVSKAQATPKTAGVKTGAPVRTKAASLRTRPLAMSADSSKLPPPLIPPGQPLFASNEPQAHETPDRTPPELHPLLAEQLGAAVADRLPAVLTWAAVARPQDFGELALAFDAFGQPPDEVLVAANILLPEKVRRKLIAKRVAELIAKRVFDIVGLLHLERLVMTPMGVERGELLYSLPLAPREMVTLSHKEWAIREDEYSRYIQDFQENYSETGVAQTSELAKTVDTQTRRQDATSANLTSLSAQPVTLTATVAPGAAGSLVDAASSLQESLAETKLLTSKASSRNIQDHRVSFTVATVRGAEDWTSRLIRNRNDDKSMLIDYYRRMRRWQNELYRDGVRLCYDIIVPHPGRRLARIYRQVRDLDEAIAKAFHPTLGPNAVTPASLKPLSGQYGVPLPAPLPPLRIEESRVINYPAPGVHVEELQLTVPPGYRLQALGYQVHASVHGGPVGLGSPPGPAALVSVGPNHDLHPAIGNAIATNLQNVPLKYVATQNPLKAVFFLRHAQLGDIRFYADVVASDEWLEGWSRQCWGILREVQLARYNEQRDTFRAQRAALQRAIDSADTLSLRRVEREHLMLACLEWLFPFLNLKAGWFSAVADTPTDFDRTMGLQASVLVKLMHTGIDWDAMLVTLLPFFWERLDAGTFVEHADPLHREFLRAGAARVVLPIRPGHEETIMSLFDLGLVSSTQQQSRFKGVIDEVTAANQGYFELTHPADAILPDGTLKPGFSGEYPIEGGKLVGRWHEDMPTGALDMDVTLRALL